MTLTEHRGDIFTTQADALAHGCNCRGVMGAGVANAVRRTFPEAFRRYRSWCEAGRFRPGVAQLVRVGGDGSHPRFIVNLATQDGYGKPPWESGQPPWAQPSWIRNALTCLVNQLPDHPDLRRLALPPLGCGYGGLFWDRPDYEAKRSRYGNRVGPDPQTYVRDLVCDVLGPTRLHVELWAPP